MGCVSGGWGHRLQEKGLVEDSQLGNRSLVLFCFLRRKTNQHFLPYLHLFPSAGTSQPSWSAPSELKVLRSRSFGQFLVFRTPRPLREIRGRPKDSGPPPRRPEILPYRSTFLAQGSRSSPGGRRVHLRPQGQPIGKSPRPCKSPQSHPRATPLEGSPQPSPRGRLPSPPREAAERPRLLSPQDYLVARSRLCASLPPSPRPPGLQRPRDPPPPPLKRRTAPEARAEGEGA